MNLEGDRNTIQTVIELVEPQDYAAVRSRLTDESRHPTAKYQIFLVGRSIPEIDELTADIFRCREIANKYRNEPDQEVKDYCNGQLDRAGRLAAELQRLIRRSLLQGSFIFRGQVSAVESLSSDLADAARKHLSTVAEQVFDRYAEAPVRVGTDLAERFLRMGNLSGITSQIDPLGLVQTQGGKPSIRVDHKALVSVRDMIDRYEPIDGKSLTERFSDAPFGWSPDTLRYLIGALLVAGELKLKSAGREITVNGQQAIEALKSNNTFKNVGVSLRRDDKPAMEVLALAANRLTELAGDLVVPLEDEISKVAIKLFPSLQQRYAPLAEKLRSLGLPGVERLESLTRDITEILLSDASDAPQRLGKQDSTLYESLKWAAELKTGLEQGLENTVRQLQTLRTAVDGLPNSGVSASLKAELADPLATIQQRLAQHDFYRAAADLNSGLTELNGRVRAAAESMQSAQSERLKQSEVELQRVPEWVELTLQEQQELLGKLEGLVLTASSNLAGLKALVNQELDIQNEVLNLKQQIERLGRERLQAKLKAEQEALTAKEGTKTIKRQLKTRARITSLSELDAMIQTLQKLRGELNYAHSFELDVELGD